jgi:hypothetical protein
VISDRPSSGVPDFSLQIRGSSNRCIPRIPLNQSSADNMVKCVPKDILREGGCECFIRLALPWILRWKLVRIIGVIWGMNWLRAFTGIWSWRTRGSCLHFINIGYMQTNRGQSRVYGHRRDSRASDRSLGLRSQDVSVCCFRASCAR